MEQVEEVVETEAITLATADGQIVRVISKEQYDRLLAAASKNKTYKCDTCNRRFTNTTAFQNHYNLRSGSHSPASSWTQCLLFQMGGGRLHQLEELLESISNIRSS